MMNKSPFRDIAIKLLIFIAVVIGLLLALSSNYVTVGQCAGITYYNPIDVRDIVIFSVIIGVGFFIYAFMCGRQTFKERAIMALLLVGLLCFVTVWGNDLLSSRTISWPYEYKVQSIENSGVKR